MSYTCEKCKEDLTNNNQDIFWKKHQTIPDAYNYGDFTIWCINKILNNKDETK